MIYGNIIYYVITLLFIILYIIYQRPTTEDGHTAEQQH